MKKYIEYELEDGSTIVVEVEEAEEEYGSIEVGRLSDAAKKASVSFQEAFKSVKPAIDVALDKLGDLKKKPDEITVEFGIKFSGKAGGFLASAGAEANFKVELKWKPTENKST